MSASELLAIEALWLLGLALTVVLYGMTRRSKMSETTSHFWGLVFWVGAAAFVMFVMITIANGRS